MDMTVPIGIIVCIVSVVYLLIGAAQINGYWFWSVLIILTMCAYDVIRTDYQGNKE